MGICAVLTIFAALAVVGGVICFLLATISDIRARQIFARQVFSQDRHEEAVTILKAFIETMNVDAVTEEEDVPELSELRKSTEKLDPAAARELAMLDELNVFADGNPDSFAGLIRLSIHDGVEAPINRLKSFEEASS